jgi:hypothetical protein
MTAKAQWSPTGRKGNNGQKYCAGKAIKFNLLNDLVLCFFYLVQHSG